MSQPRTLQERLLAAMAAGNLTVMDLARWLDRSHATVTQWTKGTQMVVKPLLDHDQIHYLLNRLEVAIRYKKGFPLPRLRSRDRKPYLLKMRERALSSKLK